ncbi:MAG: PAS domain S-box protein [Bacteroidetes bacterium]|jgi:PAS domain S-box-containing protein|nr:PAS domain S-box protein [Bacteroidota bacterium]
MFKKITDIIKNNTIIYGFVIGLPIPILGWILDFVSSKEPVTFSYFIGLYSENLLHWMLLIFPFALSALYYRQANSKENLIEEYNTEITKTEKRIEETARFAKEIGEGNFDSELQVEKEDALTQSLLLMRDNLAENSRREAEQSWIAAGKDKISNILRLHTKIDELCYEVLVALVDYIEVTQGAIYLYSEENKKLENKATYAYNRRKYIEQEFEVGHGLIGQCAYEMDYVYRTEIPEGYVSITSGILGDKKPSSILLVPLTSDEKLQGVLEFASIEIIPDNTIVLLKELGEIIARTIFNLQINARTEQLLKESQEMTTELQENEEELRQNAEEMRATQDELRKSNEQLEKQFQEVENAQKRLYSLLENASEVIAIYDEDMVMKYVSPSVEKILGFEPEEMMSGKDMDRLTRKGESALRNMFKELLNSPDEVQSIQYTYMKKDGHKIFLETTGRNLLEDPAIQGIILNSRDITERKRAEKEERMKSKMQALSENSLDMILRLSTVGQFFYANPVVEDYFNISAKEIINKTLNEIVIHEVFFNYFKETIEEIKAKPSKHNKEINVPLKYGEKETHRIMSIDAIPEFNENELETILFVGHDITEAKRIEMEIQEKNKKIEDSINYAQRIQTSILPNNAVIRDVFPKSFIFYKPRDVVSGDFPWFFKRGENIYIAAVDCTGHGVPGALLSFIGYFILNNIVDHDKEQTAAQVCDALHYGVRTTLRQDRADANQRDGMDIALCKINPSKNELQYAGAHRPLYYLSKGELEEFKGNRKAIGGIPHRKKPEKDFENYVINYKPGDKVFFFSDGLPDQLGGPEMKKYSPKRIRETILENENYSMQEYNDHFAKDFVNWKGDTKQIDDVLLIGIEF